MDVERDIVIKLHRVDEYYPGLNANDTSIHVGPHEERKPEGIQKCNTGGVVLEKKPHTKCALHGESTRSIKESIKLEPTGACEPRVTPRTNLKYVDKYEIDSKLDTNIVSDCKQTATDEWSCALSIKFESHRLPDEYSKVASQHGISDRDGHVGADTIKKISESLENVNGKFTYDEKINRKTRIADSTWSEYLSEVEGGIGEVHAKNEDSALSTNTSSVINNETVKPSPGLDAESTPPDATLRKNLDQPTNTTLDSAPYPRRNYKKISYSEDCSEDDSEDDNCDADDQPLYVRDNQCTASGDCLGALKSDNGPVSQLSIHATEAEDDYCQQDRDLTTNPSHSSLIQKSKF